MKGKACLVTGASGGIGRATSVGLARLGAEVILACRDKARGEAAKAEIVSASGNEKVSVLLVDLALQDSIRATAADFHEKYERLDVLVNVAGVYKRERVTTPDELEAMFATNHLGCFLLTNLLLDRLKTSAPSRVLVVTAPSTTQLDFDDLQGEKQFSSLHAFGASKMGNLLFTYQLARRLQGTGVTVNAVHPGLTKTTLMREASPVMQFFLQLMSRSPQKSAKGLVYLCSASELAGVTGKFFTNGREIQSSYYSHDESVQERLWDISLALTTPKK